MFKNLLVPISGDALTKAELKQAIKLAKADGAKITLAYVSDPMMPYSSSQIESVLALSQKEYQKHCEVFASKLFAKAKKLAEAEMNVKSDVAYITEVELFEIEYKL